ncbi:MAG: hypothetical protein R3C26_20020 [Calditrichia bacterium]
MDRTPRNVNMLIHNGDIWLDRSRCSAVFSAQLGQDHIKQSETAFPMVKDRIAAAGIATGQQRCRHQIATEHRRFRKKLSL